MVVTVSVTSRLLLIELLMQDAEAVPSVTQAAPKAAGKKGAEAPDAGVLTLGAFNLQPSTAVLAPGAKQAISVTFNAQGATLCLQQVGLDISDR